MQKYKDSQYKIFTIDEEMFLKTPTINESNQILDDIYCSKEDLKINSDHKIDGAGHHVEQYVIDVRNMNVYSLDTRSRKNVRL